MMSFNDEHHHNVALTGITAITELVQRLYESQESQAKTYNLYHEIREEVEALREENAGLKCQIDRLKLQNPLTIVDTITREGVKLACDDETGEED
jgi:hypothetical protein